MATLRVVFFGMHGAFSRITLQALLAANVAISAVVLPRPRGTAPDAEPIRRLTSPVDRADASPLTLRSTPPRRVGIQLDSMRGWQNASASDELQVTAHVNSSFRPLPVLAPETEPDTADLAWAHGVPVFEMTDPSHPETLAALARLQPDAFCVACFPRLLPLSVLAIPRLGALNLHPSLLPAYRGPYPLFWVFHDGIERAGVTLHLLDAGADSGPIVAQAPVDLPDGIGYGAAERRCAEEGARLLVGALEGAARHGALRSRPQPAPSGRYARLPHDEDFVVTSAWTARRAYNFMRGLAERNHPFTLRVGAHSFAVAEALSYDADAVFSEPLQWHGDVVSIRCAMGTLAVRVIS